MDLSKNKLKNGDFCHVTGGTHKGKSGRVEDLHLSKTGHLTLTVRMENGDRFKTLEKNVKNQEIKGFSENGRT